MTIRKIVAFGSILVILLGIVQALRVSIPAGASGSIVFWDPFLSFITPAVLLAVLTLISLWLSYRQLLIASGVTLCVLVAFLLLRPVSIIAFAIVFFGILILIFDGRRR